MPRPSPPLSVLELFLIFSRIGLTSFGGGVSGWMMREFVQDRGLMTEAEFLNGLALSQALPGINVTNMAIWIGHELLGTRGAVVGLLGIVVPPAFLILALAAGFSALAGVPPAKAALNGAAAAAIGLSLSMGLTAAINVPRRVLPFIVMAATFVAIGIFHLSLVWTVLVAGAISVGYAFREV